MPAANFQSALGGGGAINAIVAGAKYGAGGTAITNIRHGITGALSGGTLVVADTGSTANTRYFFTTHALGTVTVASAYYASARSAGVNFTITSSQATDTGTVDWLAIEP